MGISNIPSKRVVCWAGAPGAVLGTSIGVYGYAQYVEVYDKIARYPLSRESLVLGSNRGTRQSTETYKSRIVVNQAEPRNGGLQDAFSGRASRGYRVVSQSYDARGVHSENLEVTLPGVSRPSEIILIGAHYDSVRGSPGANDNASGVAALLELSLALVEAKLACSLRFVAFANEEPPFFYWSDMGSRVYAKAARARGDDIRLMISL
ncbi:MAG: M28 family peptidase, partial [Gammaproteobacteria bacterium]